MSNYQFSALIIEPSAVRRGYLWQATLTDVSFKRVKGMKNLEETKKVLHESKHDVFMIASSFGHEAIKEFMEYAKETPGGKEGAYILVLPADDNARQVIGQSMLDGGDGFLFTPFSTDSLREVASLAAKVKHKFESARKRAALKLFLPDVSNALDRVALAKYKEESPTEHLRVFRELASTIIPTFEEYADTYFDELMHYCSNATPRPIPNYNGASKRVQTLVKSRI